MFRQSLRKFGKDVLRWTRIKLVYQRVTLTKFTTFYFFLALVNCLVLVALQGVALSDNNEAATIISDLLVQANVAGKSLVVREGNVLETCKDLPSQPDAKCTVIKGSGHSKHRALSFDEFSDEMFNYKRSHPGGMIEFDSSGDITGIQLSDGQSLDMNCLQSLLWLNDLLRDAMREDAVTLVFHFWLFTLSFVTILNESLPHLGAALAGHLLVVGWAGFRVHDSQHLQSLYEKLVVKGTCNNVDFLGSWWDLRTQHTIPVVVLNTLAFLAATYLSIRLYKVYSQQSFNRVGASPQIHKVYKFVLFLSVSLQLAGFFTIASAAMWIDKASSGTIRYAAKHINIYRTVFSVIGVMELPWVILGWISVRRESRIQWLVFAFISILLIAASAGIFASPLYLFILSTWPFFATMTVTSYFLIISTTVLGVICRIHFGRGLPEFLKEKEVLEGADFTPVIIPDPRFDSRKASFKSEKVPFPTVDDPPPVPPLPPYVRRPEIARHSFFGRQSKSASVYSDINRETVKLSSTPALVQNEGITRRSYLDLRNSVIQESKQEEVLVRMPSNASSKSAASTSGSSGRKIGLPSIPRLGRKGST